MPKEEATIDFTFNGEIRQIIPNFKKLNLEHENYIDIGMITFAGFICINEFKKRAEKIPIKNLIDVGEAIT